MARIREVNILAARAQRDILIRQGKPVPEKVERLAALDPKILRRSRDGQSTSDHNRDASRV